MKPCRKCGVSKPLSDFYGHKHTLDGHGSWCKRCIRVSLAQYVKTPAGRVRVRLANRRYRDKNPYVKQPPRPFTCARCGVKAVAHSSPRQIYCSADCRGWSKTRRDPLNTKNKRAVLRRDNWHCYLCDRAIDPALRWPHEQSGTVDHVMPVSAGGTHRVANLRAAHWRCNVEKADTLPHWWQIAA
ncbi:MAG TPA: HNH endonuclease [Chloroflexia bacterium]|nr:HNH endonuclease [Chloroflexia bacterium]